MPLSAVEPQVSPASRTEKTLLVSIAAIVVVTTVGSTFWFELELQRAEEQQDLFAAADYSQHAFIAFRNDAGRAADGSLRILGDRRR